MVEIWNGPHNQPPVGTLEGPNGELINVWSYEPADLILAMQRAIGPIPEPQAFGLGGHVEAFYSDPTNPFSSQPPQLIYNPAGDVINQQIGAEYASKVQAWNARAQAIQAVIVAILQNRKTSRT
jgi:hypothetical protein